MADFASTTDVAARWQRDLSTEQDTAATALLAGVSALIRYLAPGIDDRIADGTLDAEIPKMVTVSAVLRVLRNPAGVRSWSIDGIQVTHDTRDLPDPAQPYITEGELDLLAGNRRRQVGTVRLRPGVRP